jgi:hypothetical protein
MSSNYVAQVIKRINQELPGLDEPLAALYALLALTRGARTTLEDVHDAWAVWTATVRGRPDHPSLVPFGELSLDVQELDRKYVDGIRRVARSL